MAEPGRRTVVIRGQVVDRYSPRRSPSGDGPGEWWANGESRSAGYRSRRSTEERRRERSQRPGARSDTPRRVSGDARPVGYTPRRSQSSGRRRRPYDPPRARPDRIALWAVLLGVVLILAAATSSHAAMLAHVIAR